MRQARFRRERDQIDDRKARISRIAQSDADVTKLKQHLAEIVEGTEFKGSHRSGQFLSYIVEKAIAGDFESLKERMIGIELFGRSPSFNTVEDAIVRVTASDVRKRLLQHYGKHGYSSEFRFNLPLGSYIPEIIPECHVADGRPVGHLLLDNADVPLSKEGLELSERDQSALSGAGVPAGPLIQRQYTWPLWRVLVILFSTIALAFWGALWTRSSRTEAAAGSALPWSVFFRSQHPTQLIMSDPDIATIQGLTGEVISVADYASHIYIPQHSKLTPEVDRICRFNLRGGATATVDAVIAMSVDGLARASSRTINVHAARYVQLSELKTDDNFIFLGSPRSDPWLSIFNDQLDFKFVFQKNAESESIQNVHPRPHEQQWYAPSVSEEAIGESYAIVALIQNPGHSGQVLLVAGESGEGTKAAGQLVTDVPRLSSALQKCTIDPRGPLQHFELLLRLNTVATSLNHADVVACHTL